MHVMNEIIIAIRSYVFYTENVLCAPLLTLPEIIVKCVNYCM